jgi:ankyrin repeat protein
MTARLGRGGCIKYLLEREANIEATNRFGENALQLAEAGGHVEAARTLMEYGMQ